MKVLAVDNEQLQLAILMECINEAVPDCSLKGFQNPVEALRWAKEEKPEVAFLDIQMPVMSGIELGKALKVDNPKINLIFVTGYYAEYIFEAVPLYFSSYLDKPITLHKVQQSMENLRYPLMKQESHKPIRVRCFGDFEIYAGDQPLAFSHGKSKEIFAYLVDRKGAKVNGGRICAAVFEEGVRESANKSRLRTCTADIKNALHAVHADEVFLKGWDSYAIDTSLIECDYYDWEKNEPYAIRAFHGEYMTQYSWAEETLAALLNHN